MASSEKGIPLRTSGRKPVVGSGADLRRSSRSVVDRIARSFKGGKPTHGFLVVIFAVLCMFLPLLHGCSGADSLTLSYSQFRQDVAQGKVSEITLTAKRITGTFKEPVETGRKGAETSHETFRTILPSFGDPQLMGLLEKQGVTVNVESALQPWMIALPAAGIPVLAIFILSWISIRTARAGGRGAGGGATLGFGQSRAKLYHKSASNVTFEDVAGLVNQKRELTEIIDFLKDPTKYRALGGRLPRGVLLTGPPGTGKTLMARAVAGEANVPFYSISGSEFVEMFVGVGASRVRDMFNKAKSDSPAIVYIDEIDSIGRVRGAGLGAGHDEREQTLNQILTEMDGFSAQEAVIVIAATNRPDVLDPALIRPGRFDRRVVLDLPQKKARRDILRVHTRQVPLDEDVDLETLAARTVGFSGADLMNLVNEAALLAAGNSKSTVNLEDFDRSRDKILMGVEREDLINEAERKIIAYHEAGHALMGLLMPGVDCFEQVSIIPRTHALGVTLIVPEEDRHNFTQSQLRNRISVMLGGRVAEKLVFNEVTTGSGDDMRKASQLARRMVSQWGMSDRLGPITYRQGEEHPFLGNEIQGPRDFSEHTARLIDEEVKRIVEETEGMAREMLSGNRHKLDALAQALLDLETLSRTEIEWILELDSAPQVDVP